MKSMEQVRFWHLMVGTGFALLGIGLVMIFLPPGVGDSESFEIEFFEASIESSEMGLALIVLGLSCFLIGRKDLADLRTYQGIQQDLEKTSTLTARLVADQVGRAFHSNPVRAALLSTYPGLDLESALGGLRNLRQDIAGGQDLSSTLRQAEIGLSLLEGLDREG